MSIATYFTLISLDKLIYSSFLTGSPQLQDGVRVVRGHVVEIKDGQQIARAAPTLEDALKLVNSPYQDLKDHEVQYYGPKDMYQDLGDDHTKLGTRSAPIMNHGQIGSLTGLSGAHNAYYESEFSIAPGNYGNRGNSNNYGSEGYDIEHEEQIRLRESALQNGGPKFAFMNDEWTDGALPQTMGRHSPAGSLTSLDSLDEVPSDSLVTKDTLCPGLSVTGIIAKDSRTKSAPRRRVTFSDSIEFDDGLTGQLVTAEKASCKQYVKLYNSRIAANNAYNASMTNAHRPTAPIVKGVHSGGVVGTPGSTPMKSNGPPSSASLQSGSSASMIVPKSIYSQIPFSGNKTVATTGEATSSSMTHTDHPIQGIAQADSRTPSAPRPPGQYGTSSLGTREMESRSNREDEEQNNRILEVKDSLDIVRDSLDCTEERVKQEHTTDEDKDSLTEEPVFESDTTDGSSNECREPTIREGTQDEFHHVDYYGHPTNIYRNPFGQKISTEEASQTFNTTTANMAVHSSSTQILTTSSGSTHTLASSSAGQHEGAGHRGDYEQDSKQENGSKSTSRESGLSGNDSLAKNSAYYRSWYPGSFFPSKPQEGRDRDVNDGDDEVFEQPGYNKKNNSVAFNIMDEPPKQRKQVTDSRLTNQRNENICDQGTSTYKYTSNVQGTPDRDRYGTGYTATNPQATYTNIESKRTTSVQTTGYPISASRTTSKESNNSENRNRGQKVVSPAGGHGMTAKPPHPSTRHKGVVYSSPLHRKRAAAAVRHHTGKTSPRGRKTVIKKKEDPQERNVRNQKKNDRKNATKKAAGVESENDEDEMIQSIKRDMERISMRCNSSPAQEEHQNIIRSINLRGHHIDSPLGSQVPDQNDSNPEGGYTKSDFRTVYKKVHQPRVGSAKSRGQKNTPNMVPPSRIPTYVGTTSNGPSRAGEEGRRDGSNNSINPAFHATPTWSAEQGVPTYANELHHPQTTHLKRSISLDKTPTDDEINFLWDRVRNCLHHKDTQSVGSDSCVNRIDVRRSQAKQFIPQGSQDNTLRDPETSRDRSSSIAGMGTIGGLRRYGSHEVLRRYGSADNLGYRPQPLLHHRALRTRQSGQGKPPIVPRQQMNFTPMSSRQAPSVSLSTRGK